VLDEGCRVEAERARPENFGAVGDALAEQGIPQYQVPPRPHTPVPGGPPPQAALRCGGSLSGSLSEPAAV
jgi:hypothetical protein